MCFLVDRQHANRVFFSNFVADDWLEYEEIYDGIYLEENLIVKN